LKGFLNQGRRKHSKQNFRYAKMKKIMEGIDGWINQNLYWTKFKKHVFVVRIVFPAMFSAGMKNDYKGVFCVATVILV
jgi:hypothetical protein